MNSIRRKRIVRGIFRIHQQHPWIWVYLVALVAIIAWSTLYTRYIPDAGFTIILPGGLTYDVVAPGWINQGFIRSIAEPWLRWDTSWYLLIAQEGYSLSGLEVAFPPFYPFLIGIVAKLLGGQYLIAALIISWASLFGVCLLLQERFMQWVDQKTALRGIRSLLFFPTAFFFFAGYTEALFLFLALMAWRYADRGQWLFTGLWGALATMTKFIGGILVLPFGLIWLKNWRENKDISSFPLLLIPISYFGWSQFASLNYLMSPFEAQTKGWNSHFDWPWVGILGSLRKIASRQISETLPDLLYIMVILLVVYSIIWWLKREYYPESLFLATVIFISLMKITNGGLLASVSRFAIILFPMYLTLAGLGENPKYDRVILVVSIFLWLLFSALFFTWNWVA